MGSGADGVCKFYGGRAAGKKKPRYGALGGAGALLGGSGALAERRFAARGAVAGAERGLAKAFRAATGRGSRTLRLALRKLSVLHLLILPALVLLLVEMPGSERYTGYLTADRGGAALDRALGARAAGNAGSAPVVEDLVSSKVLTREDAVKPGISIVACCMNRHETLKKVLNDWKQVDNVDEIIVVDWSSAPPLKDVVDFEGDARVRVIRVEGEAQWVLSRAYNLGMSASTRENIIRTDCDYSLGKDFVRSHSLEPAASRNMAESSAGVAGAHFYAGNYKQARNENEVHLNGAVYIRRRDFFAIGGYDERIQTYGWDDEDLYTRLNKSGLAKHNISYDHVTHVPHGDVARAQKDVKFVQVEIDLNSLLLEKLPSWNYSNVAVNTHWAAKDGVQATPKYAVVHAAKRVPSLKDLTPKEKVTEAWNLALGRRLSNDYQVPWDIMETMDVSSKRNLLTRLNTLASSRSPEQPPRILFAHCMHGLGNRLRALGSAMSFAKNSGRILVVIWETDSHISAKFSDLFDSDLVVMDSFKPTWPFKEYDRYDKSWLSFEFFNYMEMEGQGAQKGQWIVDKPNMHFYYKGAYIMEADQKLTSWDMDNAMLRTLQPVEEVARSVAEHEKAGLQNMVGVHIRDRTLERDIKNVNFASEYGEEASKTMEYWRQKSSHLTFMEEMRHQLKSDPTLSFYVATDTVEVLEKLKREFPGKIRTTPRDCDGRDGRCVRYALVDILCLAKTRSLLGSNWSSFTEAAERIGGKKALLAGEHFAKDADRPKGR